MGQSIPESEPSLLATVDFRAFFETLRLRWWVVPVVIALTFGFLQAQDSDLRTEPASYVVSRGYEVGTPFAPFLALGINVAATEFPDPMTQLLILKSTDTRQEIAAKIDKDVEVKLPENWEMPVTFVCNQPVKSDCEKAIDAYVDKAKELRKDAILTGVKNLRAVLSELQSEKPDPATADRILALDLLSKQVDVPFALVDGFEQEIGPTVNDVRRPTLLIGLAAGLLIALLILLQLTVSDSRVRSVRQLVRLTGTKAFLGNSKKKASPINDRRAALTIHGVLTETTTSQIRYIPLRKQPTDVSPLARLAEMCGATFNVTQPFAEMNVKELAGSGSEVDVIVVERNRDLRADVLETLAGLHSSGRQLAGVLLVN